MSLQTIVKRNAYYDSVTLMVITRELQKLDGVEDVLVGMGTELNLDMAKDLGLAEGELDTLTANDLFIAAKIDEAQVSMQEIEEAFNDLLNKKTESDDEDYNPPSLSSAIQSMPGANIVLVSVPGQYAAAEVEEALEAGLHVMLFSDNVSVEEELRLKQKAVEKGLLMMGPDCGTAIINGIPLCFANAVRRGKIGVVGASGTGTQEVTVQVHKLGEGLSQVIGTGGRDLKEQIGGLMMIQAFESLIADPETEVVVLISKPPDASVAEKIYAIAKNSPKPVVIDFIGGDRTAIEAVGAIPCISLEDAAQKAVKVLKGQEFKDFAGFSLPEEEITEMVERELAKLSSDQTELRAFFTGGTLADEAMKILGQNYQIYSNIPLSPELAIENLPEGRGHICVDLGEDQFTRGRPHPMIDPQTRTDFFKSHVDEQTAIILVDVVLGFGSHKDPAGAVADSVREIRQQLSKKGRDVVVIASVCGTDLDSQDLNKSVASLEAEGILVMPSNAQATRLTDRIMQRMVKGV